MYLLAIVWLSVLIGASASNSFQRVSATPERRACVDELVRILGNPDMIVTGWVNTVSNAVTCLAHSEPATPEKRACVDELRIPVNPNATFVELVDTISNAVICLSHT